MCNRARQFDVTHAVATNLGQRDFNATFFTDYAAMLESLVLATKAFVVFHRAKDLGAKQTIALRLEGTVIDGFRLLHLAERPGANHVG